MQTHQQSDTARDVTIFSSVLVGIDGSPESFEAARQAARLAEGPLTLVASYDPVAGLVGGVGPAVPAYVDEGPLRDAAESAIEQARAEIPALSAAGKVGVGRAWEVLLDELDREQQTLVAVGSHGTGRALGIVIGSTATELIHKAPCSVLVARATPGKFPSRIVVGLDGSEESAAAYETAKKIAERFHSRLGPVVAHVDDHVDLDAVQRLTTRYRGVNNLPVESLVSASADADLVVVGSRGLRGVKALGSVSERVAHQAACSVLIVRRPS